MAHAQDDYDHLRDSADAAALGDRLDFGPRPTRFTLVVQPDGHAFLTSRDRLSTAEQEAIHALLIQWQSSRWPPAVAIMDDCAVVQVVDVALDLAVPA